MKYLVFVLSLILISCNQDLSERAKNEIKQVEHEFDSITKIKGVKEAFFEFADDSSVFLRGNNKLIKGKNQILKFYTEWPYKEVSLEWAPSFVDAAKSGDLGYTYGNYKFKGRDTTGKLVTGEGIFHTVWKKNKEGKWKVVWD